MVIVFVVMYVVLLFYGMVSFIEFVLFGCMNFSYVWMLVLLVGCGVLLVGLIVWKVGEWCCLVGLLVMVLLMLVVVWVVFVWLKGGWWLGGVCCICEFIVWLEGVSVWFLYFIYLLVLFMLLWMLDWVWVDI